MPPEISAQSHEPSATLQISDFRKLLIGRLLVTLAVQIQSMAVGWQIYALTKSALSLGMIGLAEALPAIGVALYAGHVADVIDRKKIALASLAVIVLCIGGLAVASTSTVSVTGLCAIIYLLVAISGFGRGFYTPSVFGLVSQIVPRNLYGNAAAWNSTLWQLSAIGGPIIGGFLYVRYGAVDTYIGSSVLAAIGVAFIASISSRSDLSSAPRGSVYESIMEGLRFVFSNQVIFGAMALDLFGVLFGGAVALLPIFADQIFHRGPEALGLLRAAPSVGAFIVATSLAFHPIKRHAGYIFLTVVAGFGLCMIGFAISKSFVLALSLLAISGFFDGISVYIRSTIYQQYTPEEMKGRVAAVNSIFIGSSNEIGEFESGVMARLLGTIRSVVIGGTATLGCVAFTAWKAPRLRKLELQ